MCRLRRLRSRDQEEIQALISGAKLLTEQVTQPTPHPIALHRAAERSRSAQPDPRPRPCGPHRSQDQEPTGANRPVAADRVEVRLAPKHLKGRHLGSSSPSGAELLAPLRPTTGKHAPTTLRSHASAEAVFPLPGALLGLVGPLHEWVLVLVQRRRFGSITQQRLASSPASRDGREHAARLALPGDHSDAPSGVSNLRTPVGGNLNESIAGRERVLLHYRDPRGPTPI